MAGTRTLESHVLDNFYFSTRLLWAFFGGHNTPHLAVLSISWRPSQPQSNIHLPARGIPSACVSHAHIFFALPPIQQHLLPRPNTFCATWSYHLLSSPLYSRFKQEEFLKGVKSSHWLSFLLRKPLQTCVAVVSCPNPRVCFVVILCFDLSGWFVFVSCLAICGWFILSPSPCGRIVFALCLGPRGRLWLLWLSYGCLWLWCLQ